MQHILSLVRRCVEDYQMIEEGDTVAVGVSGGKDSVLTLAALAKLRAFYPKRFQVEAVTIDSGTPGMDFSPIAALCRELDDKRAALHRLEADILRMEGVCMMENAYHVILLEDPEQKVFSIRKTVGVHQYHEFFNELFREATVRGLTQAGPIQMLYHDEAFNRERSDVEVQMVVAQDGPDVKLKPACTCAAVQHRGSYENLHLAYEALCAWLGEHTEYRMCGPAMDRYFGDPDNTPPEALETGVLFPVERV